MKKAILILPVVLLLFLAVSVPTASAQGLVNCGQGTTACTWADLYDMISTVISFLIFDFGIPLAVIIVIVSGIQLVLHPSSATAQTVWKERLWKGLMGLIIMICAYLLVKVVVWGLTEGRDNYDLRSTVEQ